jgi:hypothetical protein
MAGNLDSLRTETAWVMLIGDSLRFPATKSASLLPENYSLRKN